MAQKKDYGLPDETLQLIAAAPSIFAGNKYLEPRYNINTRLPGSELIAALRASGTDNHGFTQYANAANADSASARTARRGLFAPSRLTMGRVTRDVTLPTAEPQTPVTRTPQVMGPLLTVDDVEDWPGDIVEYPDDSDKGVAAVDGSVSPNISVGTPVVDTIVGGTGNDTITGGTGTGGTGGTGTAGTGGTGTAGTGGTGTGGLGGTGTTGTGVTAAGTGTTGGTGDLRDAITAAMGGSGSIDNSAAGVDAGGGSLSSASGLTADQIAALTRPKVPSVTLESSGPALDQDTGATSMTFDYPELLTPEELKAYEAWMATQGGGGTGAGKPVFDETAGTLEF